MTLLAYDLLLFTTKFESLRTYVRHHTQVAKVVDLLLLQMPLSESHTILPLVRLERLRKGNKKLPKAEVGVDSRKVTWRLGNAQSDKAS